MGKERGLDLLNIHRDIEVDVQLIIDRFSGKKYIYITMKIFPICIICIFKKNVIITNQGFDWIDVVFGILHAFKFINNLFL